MKIELEELLAHSFVLTIDDKRFQTFKKVFEHHNLNPIPKKWTGHSEWWNSPIYNCYLSHKDIVGHARKNNWDFVCVFEDDAWPINGVVDKLKFGRGDAARQFGAARRVPMEAVALLEGKDAQEFALIEEGDDAEFLVGLAEGLAGRFGEGRVVHFSI